MECKYFYQGRKIGNIKELNSFLSSQYPHIKGMSDVVFSRLSDFSKPQQQFSLGLKGPMEHAARLHRVDKETIAVDGEALEIYDGIGIGTSQFLTEYVNPEGKIITPYFDRNQYWTRRIIAWDKANKLRTLRSNGEVLEEGYTQEEVDLLEELGALSSGTLTELHYDSSWLKGGLIDVNTLPKDSVHKQLIDLIENRWTYQAKLGTAIHNILGSYFKEVEIGGSKCYQYELWEGASGESKIKDSIDFFRKPTIDGHKNQNYIDPKYLSDDQIKHIIGLAKTLRENLETRLGKGSKLMYFTETSLDSQINVRMPSQPDDSANRYMKGRFDLLVVDKSGNVNVIDFKVGNKNYDQFDSAKRLSYTYQLALYNRLLQRNGLLNPSAFISDYIVPIEVKNLKQSSGAFSYDDLVFNMEGEVPYKNITDDTNASNIIAELDTIMPLDDTPLLENMELVDKISDITKVLFGSSPRKKEMSVQEVKNLITENGVNMSVLEPNDKGYYVYDCFEEGPAVSVPKDKGEVYFLQEIAKRFTATQSSLSNLTNTLAGAIEYSKEQKMELSDFSFDLKKLGQTNLSLLEKYQSPAWRLRQDALAQQLKNLYNILIFENVNKENEETSIEVVRLSTNPVLYSYANTKDEYNNCNFQFASNFSEESKQESKMLKATQGNIDMLETLLILNEVGIKNTKLNNLVVMNPFGSSRSRALTAKPEEFEYTLNTLLTQAKNANLKSATPNKNITELKNNFGKKEGIKFANSIEQLINIYNSIKLESESGKYLSDFAESMDIIKANINNYEKLRNNLLNLIDQIVTKYPRLKQDKINGMRFFSDLVTSNSSENRAKLLFIAANSALLEINGFKERQALRDHDNYVDSFLKGWQGNEIDNPGNYGNYLVNEVSKLIVNNTQDIRDRIMNTIKENREMVQELDQKLGNSRISQWVVNPNSRFKGMTYITADKSDVRFINPWTKEPEGNIPPYFTEAHFDYLKKVILKLNRLRYPTDSEKLIQQNLEAGRNLEKYLQVPLLPPNTKSKLSEAGITKTIQNKFHMFTSTEAFKKALDRTIGEFKDNELHQDTEDEEIFQVMDIFSSNAKPERRQKLIEDWKKEFGEDTFYNNNIEEILGQYEQAIETRKAYKNIMPVVRAVTICLQQQSAVSKIKGNFNNDLTTIENLVKSKVNNLSIISPNLRKITKVTSTAQRAASYLTLACSPIQATGQITDGIVKLLKLAYTYHDVEDAPFTSKELNKALGIVLSSIKEETDQSFIDQLNIQFGINDMDLKNYVSTLKESKSFSLYDFDRFAFYCTSRPDFYNRMTLFVAQMMKQGTFDAYSFKNGRLEYDCTKDARFKALWEMPESSKEYQDAKARYYATALLLQEEGALNPDKTPFRLNPSGKLQMLPKPYSNKEIESMKALGDNLYGYYDHAKKSLFQSTWVGGLVGQMKTFWSAKKNMYMGSAGYKNQGYWDKVKNPDPTKKNVYLCFKLKENGDIDYTQRVWSDDPQASKIVCLRWTGKFQEGIIQTLARIATNDKAPLYSRILHPKKTLYEMCMQNDEFNKDMYESCVANLNLFLSDLIGFLIMSLLLSLVFGPLRDEASKKSKESKKIEDQVDAAAWSLAFGTLNYAASDTNAFMSIVSPTLNWEPFAFQKLSKTAEEALDVITGEKNALAFVAGNTAPGKIIIKPNLPRKEREENT